MLRQLSNPTTDGYLLAYDPQFSLDLHLTTTEHSLCNTIMKHIEKYVTNYFIATLTHYIVCTSRR